MSAATSPRVPPQDTTLKDVVSISLQRALHGGVAGSISQISNVVTMMWLRQTMDYQYRNGGTMLNALQKLHSEGGVRRFYRGMLPALIQSPLSRFGDAASNTGVLVALDSFDLTRSLPIPLKTGLASSGAAVWRILMMPLDNLKSAIQQKGRGGTRYLYQKVRMHGFSQLFVGGGAMMSATWVGHYPWFITYNFINSRLPDHRFKPYVSGFCASVTSDTVSNSLRVLKSVKQSSPVPITYPQALRTVVDKDGIMGLFGRGLRTRILTNAMQGMVFSVGMKVITQKLEQYRAQRRNSKLEEQ